MNSVIIRHMKIRSVFSNWMSRIYPGDVWSSIASDVSSRLPGTQRVQIAGFDATTGNPSGAHPNSANDHFRMSIDSATTHLHSDMTTLRRFNERVARLDNLRRN